MSPRLLVVSPVRDEAAHLRRVAAAVAAQRRPPDRWIVIDDGSTDGTPELARELARELPFMDVRSAPAHQAQARDRLAVAAEARAFNVALAGARAQDYDFVGKLDGDIELEPGHFERLLAAFAAEPRLGIAGAYLLEETARGWRPARMPPYHVNGAVKLYRRRCLDDIGGVPERLGWDTIDETRARMRGWATRSLPAAGTRHLRRSGGAGGLVRGSARHGECVWIVGYPPSIVALRAARLLVRRPPVVGGLAFAAGYARAALRREIRDEDAELRAFARAEQRRRLRRALRARVAGRHA